jgi:membrane-associated phospholipid phosphatase
LAVHLIVALFVAADTAAAQAPEGSASGEPITNAQSEQNRDVAPPPAETTWRSLVKDTARDFISFPRRPSTYVLLAGGGILALAAHPADDYVETHVVGNPTADRVFATGKVLGSAGFQVGAALGMYVVGRRLTKGEPRTHPVTHLGFDLIRSQILAQTIVHGIKYSAQRDRPTGECCAFPSGHATSAFAAAAVLERHLGYRGSWPALVAASYVATSRLVDHRHFLSDVVFGAAIGEAVGWTVVGRHRTSRFALQPVPVRGGMMIALVRRAE